MQSPSLIGRPLLGLELPRHFGRPLVARGVPGRDLGEDGQHVAGRVGGAEAGDAGDGDVLAGPDVGQLGRLVVGAGDA